MTYLDAARNLESMYVEACKKAPVSRYMYLARMASAISKKDGRVTEESVNNLRVLASKIQSWMRMSEADLSEDDSAKLITLISLLSSLFDCFQITLQTGAAVEEVFGENDNCDSFDQVLNILNDFKDSSDTQEFDIQALGEDQNMGNLLPVADYVGGQLHVYPPHPLADNLATAFDGYYIATNLQSLLDFTGNMIQVAESNPDQFELAKSIALAAWKVAQKQPSEAILIFESCVKIDRKTLPFKYVRPRSKAEDGVICGSYTDKLSKRVKLFVV